MQSTGKVSNPANIAGLLKIPLAAMTPRWNEIG